MMDKEKRILMTKKPTYKELEQKVKELEKKVAERNRADEVLKNAYQTTRDIIEKAPFGIYIVNTEGYIDYVNPAMVRIAGDEYEQFKNLNAFELPTYRKIGLSQKIKSGLKGEYFKMEAVKYTSHFGHKTTIRNFIGIPLLEEGKKKVLMVVDDITKAKLVEKELIQHRQHLQGMVAELVKEHIDILTEANEQLREEIFAYRRVEEKLKTSSEKLRLLFTNLQSIRKDKKSGITREIQNELGQILTAIQTEMPS
jgi:PAS domain S-box-containing protein